MIIETNHKYHGYFGRIYIQSFKIDIFNIKIEHFYDIDHNGNRYSYSISYPGGTMGSGGYEDQNGILFPTFGITLDRVLKSIYPDNISKRRDIKLNIILDTENL